MGSVDAYVEVSLVPWASKPEKTETKKKEQNPTFNETFRFQVYFVETLKFMENIYLNTQGTSIRNHKTDTLHASV